MEKIIHKLLKLVAMLLFAASGQASYAATLTFELDSVINGSTPSGSAPWMTATFADGAANHVTLTLHNAMGSSQFISDAVFNSLVDPTTLTFDRIDAFPPPTINGITKHAVQDLLGGAEIKAGFFNIYIDLAPPPGNQVWNAAAGDVIFDIFGTDLDALDFNVLSLPGGPGFVHTDYMAAKVQGIPGDLSGSVGTIPEPEIYAMLAAGLGLMGFVARRRKQQAAAA